MTCHGDKRETKTSLNRVRPSHPWFRNAAHAPRRLPLSSPVTLQFGKHTDTPLARFKSPKKRYIRLYFLLRISRTTMPIPIGVRSFRGDGRVGMRTERKRQVSGASEGSGCARTCNCVPSTSTETIGKENNGESNAHVL